MGIAQPEATISPQSVGVLHPWLRGRLTANRSLRSYARQDMRSLFRNVLKTIGCRFHAMSGANWSIKRISPYLTQQKRSG